MLAHEIEPFADAHIEALKATIEDMVVHIADPDQLTPKKVREWYKTLHVAIGGFERFKVCMVDEVEQKERYRQTLRDFKIRPNLKAGS